MALVLCACGAQDEPKADAHGGSHGEHEAKPSTTETADAAPEHGTDAAPAKRTPLRAGERKVTVRMPKPYTPSAPTGTGTHDYRCFLLDPKVPSDQFITGFKVKPGNPEVVHHVILFRVPADLVAQAEKRTRVRRGRLDLLRRQRAGLRQGTRWGARQGFPCADAGAPRPVGRQAT